MSGPEFFQTRMGQKLFEVTLPKIADELGRLNTTLQPIATALQALTCRPPTEDSLAGAVETNLKAVLVQLTRVHLPVDDVEPRAEALDLHETIASALGIALRAACQVGVAATLRELRADLRDDAATPR